VNYLQILLAFIGGLGLFIYGMHIMADGLQKSAGTKMKKFLEVITSKKGLGVAAGAAVTAIIQSSSATTVMVVGFVNAGLLTLQQAVGVIMGANIGTTVTGWLVSSVEWLGVLSPSKLAPVALAIGVVMVMFTKKEKLNKLGEIITGFGMLFMGITMMSDGVSPLRDAPVFRQLFLTLGSNPLFGVLAGAFVTAVIQSSSASVGILQTLAASKLVPWDAAVYIIMGQNIGTCVTAMLSSIGANKNAKRAAYIHLLFNITGSVIFSIGAIIFFKFNSVAGNFLITQTEISLVHTVFNVANTMLLYPFSSLLIKMSEFFVQSSKAKDDTSKANLVYLDERILGTPNMAVQSANKEVLRMGEIVGENLRASLDALLKRDNNKFDEISELEKDIDSLDKSITSFLVKMCNSPINEEENNIITAHFHTVNDFERIGDHCMNIAEIVKYMIDEDAKFSDVALKEIGEMVDTCWDCYKTAYTAKEKNDYKLAKKVIDIEDKVDKMEEELRARHIQRLTNNLCDTKSSVALLDSLTNLERIADHCSNIAQSVINETENKLKRKQHIHSKTFQPS